MIHFKLYAQHHFAVCTTALFKLKCYHTGIQIISIDFKILDLISRQNEYLILTLCITFSPSKWKYYQSIPFDSLFDLFSYLLWDWTDSFHISSWIMRYYAVNGISAQEVCCVCHGGQYESASTLNQTPLSPRIYEDKISHCENGAFTMFGQIMEFNKTFNACKDQGFDPYELCLTKEPTMLPSYRPSISPSTVS